MKKCLLIVAALGVASALAQIDQSVQNDEPILLPLTNLTWHCGPNTRIENGILTVDVPPEKAKHGGSAWVLSSYFSFRFAYAAKYVYPE